MMAAFWIVASFVLGVLETVRAEPGPKCRLPNNRTIAQVTDCIKHDYDKVQRPFSEDGGPLRVHVDLVVIKIGNLDAQTNDFSFEFYMRQRWIDPTLKYNKSSLYNKNYSYAILDHTLVNNLWKPDTYIENLKRLEMGFSGGPFINEGLRLFPNGLVLISSRVSATLSCAMNFHNFPMDRQSCSVTISSYFFTEDDLYYDWNDVSIYKGNLSQFDLLGLDSLRKSLVFTSGTYSSLVATFRFRRRIQNYLLSFYVPTILTVMLSWVSFFISPNSAPARCALGIITVLAVGGFLTNQRKSFPTVSYVMSADLYILVCYVFVFCALLEYAVVHFFFVYDKQLLQFQQQQEKLMNQKDGNAQDIIDEGEFEEDADDDNNQDDQKPPSKQKPSFTTVEAFNKVAPECESPGNKPARGFGRTFLKVLLLPLLFLKKGLREISENALIVDKVSRVLFPGTFALFNAIYWGIYLEEH